MGSAVFALLGLVLAVRAWKASSSPGIRDLVTKIGVQGMTAALLEDGPPTREPDPAF